MQQDEGLARFDQRGSVLREALNLECSLVIISYYYLFAKFNMLPCRSSSFKRLWAIATTAAITLEGEGRKGGG
jgi:hypothetical protein